MLNRNEMDVVNYYTLVVGNKLLKDQRLIMRYSNRINSELKFLNLKKFILLNIKAKIFFFLSKNIKQKRSYTHQNKEINKNDGNATASKYGILVKNTCKQL